ncbi:unnamed protein product [Cuscuta campestris]|uniref:Sugar phosphate transporter domain-containing protein n=2 Tax=Cuscuta sect. Cleistogrammica TaxID=1824901 RepID=A0A484MBT7_9ASTE|nr:unnamed protein product [Cuscuta campestris]
MRKLTKNQRINPFLHFEDEPDKGGIGSLIDPCYKCNSNEDLLDMEMCWKSFSVSGHMRCLQIGPEDDVQTLHVEIVSKLRCMLDAHNVLVQSFRIVGQMIDLVLSEDQIRNYALIEIECLLRMRAKSLRDFIDMPFPRLDVASTSRNRLILDELNYDHVALKEEHQRMIGELNHEQRSAYETIMESIDGGHGKREMKNEEQARSLFGISLTERPRWQQFLLCVSGFFFGYLVNGICEEYVYNRLQFSYGWYFTFVQGWVYIFLIYLQGFTTKQMVNPWKTYLTLSAVLMGSHGLTKGSLAFLNYPAQLMFKSTKVLPVMIMGAFIPGLKRKYPPHEYISAILLVVGLIIFTLADAQTSPNFSIIGVVMISGALIMDSFLGNLQEAIFKMNPETTQMEMLFCSTMVGFPFLIPPMVLTGELSKAWTSCSQHPYVYGVLVFEAMATFVGQVSVLSLIALFGAATTAMVTTARKAVTLLLSYIIFTKPLTEQHGTGLLLVSMGILLKMMPDNKPRKPVRLIGSDDEWEKKSLTEGDLVNREQDDERKPLV